MENVKIVDKLNAEYSDTLTSEKFGKIIFYQGSILEEAVKIITETVPYGKVATLFFSGEYEKFGKMFAGKLKQLGIKPISVIMPDNFSNTVQQFSKLFTLPEDVRMVVAFDSRLMLATKYFSSIRNVPSVFCLNEFNDLSFLSPKLTVKNFDKIDVVNVSANMHVILDEQAMVSADKAELFSEIQSKIVSLFDYRVYCKLHGKRYVKSAYDLLSDVINDTTSIFLNKVYEQSLTLIQNRFLSELANIISDGNLWLCSAEYGVKRILGNLDGFNRINFLKIVLFLYELNFSGKFSHITEIPDYNLRAEKLAEFIQTDDQSFLKNFQSQIQVLNVAKEKITQVGSALYKEIKKINQSYNLIQNTYYALGGSGKQQKDLIFALIHSGDVSACVNGMSLLRESGILEYVQV